MACVAFDVAGLAVARSRETRQAGVACVAFGVAGLALARSREPRQAGESEGLAQGAIQQFWNTLTVWRGFWCCREAVWRAFWCCRASFRTFEGNEGSRGSNRRAWKEAAESEGLAQGAIRQFRNAINRESGVAFWCFREEPWPWVRLKQRWAWRNNFPIEKALESFACGVGPTMSSVVNAIIMVSSKTSKVPHPMWSQAPPCRSKC